ncbi:MAG: zf-HC2 domain-containing protein [candidate division Zixibacteria bacterium]|nr:zf-HC2 domain-containing protein [candidate division Zixibacteria bacterium]MDD5426886.1 zf-HC2 domain-containing protein [candidate division Zixibacteria bacterium]
MRCRKARSYLSAYSNNELTGRRLIAVREHLSTCTACRKEELIYRSLNRVGKELSEVPVSADFNARLLDRIARERFAETRTKAYLPRTAPVLQWWKVIPSVASVIVVCLLAYQTFRPSPGYHPERLAHSDDSLDDSYLTVQPVNNPNMEVDLNKLLAKVERSESITASLIRQEGFSSQQPMETWVSAFSSSQVPYVNNYYRINPVIRIYNYQAAPHTGGIDKVY